MVVDGLEFGKLSTCMHKDVQKNVPPVMNFSTHCYLSKGG